MDNMTMWFVLMPILALFILINVIIGCYVAICLGFGPPNWQTALNLVVPLTTLQSYYNDWRDWLDEKAPKIANLLNRCHVPKQIMLVDPSLPEVPEPEEEYVEEAEETGDGESETDEEPADETDSESTGTPDAQPVNEQKADDGQNRSTG
jgi:hypothetical protein